MTQFKYREKTSKEQRRQNDEISHHYIEGHTN